MEFKHILILAIISGIILNLLMPTTDPILIIIPNLIYWMFVIGMVLDYHDFQKELDEM